MGDVTVSYRRRNCKKALSELKGIIDVITKIFSKLDIQAFSIKKCMRTSI